ncbi:hypothetical protein AALB53_16340 [Lachnospiraceae bacterium 47-T17]
MKRSSKNKLLVRNYTLHYCVAVSAIIIYSVCYFSNTRVYAEDTLVPATSDIGGMISDNIELQETLDAVKETTKTDSIVSTDKNEERSTGEKANEDHSIESIEENSNDVGYKDENGIDEEKQNVTDDNESSIQNQNGFVKKPRIPVKVICTFTVILLISVIALHKILKVGA